LLWENNEFCVGLVACFALICKITNASNLINYYGKRRLYKLLGLGQAPFDCITYYYLGIHIALILLSLDGHQIKDLGILS